MKEIFIYLMILFTVSCATIDDGIVKEKDEVIEKKDEIIRALKNRLHEKGKQIYFLEDELEQMKLARYEDKDSFGSAFNVNPTKVYGIVEKGDCLWNISGEYFGNPYRWREIYETNDIDDPDLIYPGQKLILPWR